MPEALRLLELGGVVLGLALLARVAGRFGVPAMPLYLLAGLAFGEGGFLPLVTTRPFIETGAQVGLILLLFMLGLEYSAAELTATMRRSARAGVLNLALNFTPGLVAGFLLGWGPVAALFLAGVTLVTSSSVVAKVLQDLRWVGNREAPTVLSITVMEDLTMAVYLPVLAALLVGGVSVAGLASVLAAVGVVALLLGLALRVEVGLSRLVFSRSDEALLLTLVGFALLVAGVTELLQVSAAVGALLAGIMLSGPAAQGARALLVPVRDVFAALFFAFVGLRVDPAAILPALASALALAAVSAVAKFATGWVSAAWAGVGPRGRARAGALLVAHGEFSLAVATLAVSAGVEPALAPLSVAYVLTLAVASPLLARLVEPAFRVATALRARAATASDGDHTAGG